MDSTRSFLRTAKEPGIQIATHLGTFFSPKEYLQKLQRFGIKITVAFVPQSEAVGVLCTAYLNGFRWPDYAWIFTDVSKNYDLKDYIIVKLKLSIMLYSLI